MTKAGQRHLHKCFMQFVRDAQVANSTEAPWQQQAKDAIYRRAIQLQGMLELAEAEEVYLGFLHLQHTLDAFFAKATATAVANAKTEWASGEDHYSACARMYSNRAQALSTCNKGDGNPNGNNGKSGGSVHDQPA